MDYAIGCIGAGFIMKDVQVVAYREAGFRVAAIASRTPERARAAADERGIPKAYDSYQELLEDRSIDIVDIAYPPHRQVEIIREAARHAHVKGILAQKPLAMNRADAEEAVRACEEAGIPLAVNQNMRFDHGIRELKGLLERNDLGEPVLATIEMRAVPHWQSYLRHYDRLTLLNMSIHHLDAFRYLFGEPERVFVSARRDPRTAFEHRDGIVLYVLEYANGLRTAAWDDVWAGPEEGAERDLYLRWRVEGVEGMARGTVGWPFFPERRRSTIEFTTRRHPAGWHSPPGSYPWFPDAFAGPMASLMRAARDGGPVQVVAARDHLRTMALVDACYRSLDERGVVTLAP